MIRVWLAITSGCILVAFATACTTPTTARQPSAAGAVADEPPDPAEESRTASEHYATAREYRAAGEYGLALVEIDQAIASSPTRFVNAEHLRSELRAEATQVVQQVHASATQGARAAATAEASRPITIQGRGQTATEPVRPPATQSWVTFVHNGRSNFIVRAAVGNERPQLLVNKIGSYEGTRLLVASAPVIFDIQADGAWGLILQPVPGGDTPAFSGNGDAVGGRFTPPGNGAWTFSHDGRSNFVVRLHCSDGRPQLIQNRIGAASGSQLITFGRGPCFWEVQADGHWSLAPR